MFVSLPACMASLGPRSRQAGGHEATTGMGVVHRGKKMQGLGRGGVGLCLPTNPHCSHAPPTMKDPQI